MTAGQRKTTYISVSMAVRDTGLSDPEVRLCIEREFIVEPLSAEDLAELRRVRRLQELGVNWAGIEIILNMRRRLQAMQAEQARWHRRGRWYGWSAPEDLWQRRLPWEPDRE